jgi:hypothetical protein
MPKSYFFEAPVFQKSKRLGLDRFIKKRQSLQPENFLDGRYMPSRT